MMPWESYAEKELMVLDRRRGKGEDEAFEQCHQACLKVSAEAGCLVSAVRASIGGGGGGGGGEERGQGRWQFQASGSYKAVMRARRMIMEEFKPEVRCVFLTRFAQDQREKS